MSSYLVGLVFDRYRGPANLKLTLLAIADAANRETNQARVSYELLAGFSATLKRQAIRNVATLIEEGVVELREQGGFTVDTDTGRQVFVSNVYEVNKNLLELSPSWKAEVRRVRKPRRSSHGDIKDTVQSDTEATVSSYPQDDSHGDIKDTVFASPTTPCSGVIHDTLTKTLEPRDKDQGLADGAVENSRVASLSDRRRFILESRGHLAEVARDRAVSGSKAVRR